MQEQDGSSDDEEEIGEALQEMIEADALDENAEAPSGPGEANASSADSEMVADTPMDEPVIDAGNGHSVPVTRKAQQIENIAIAVLCVCIVSLFFKEGCAMWHSGSIYC